jgi:hypothetical protein
MTNTTDQLIANRFEAGRTNVDDLVAPLEELAQDSSTLIVGYAPTASRRREHAIPYFHVCGAATDKPSIHALIVGGWFGTEARSPYAIARLVAAMEQRAVLAAGLEVTAIPVANVRAHREGTFLTDAEGTTAPRCWEESTVDHVPVLEKELHRYPYDIVIFLRENPRAKDTDVEAWLVEDSSKRVLGDALRKHAKENAGFKWKANPSSPVYRRTFTPVPRVAKQPAEIIVGLAAAKSPDELNNETVGLVFALLHSLREARAAGAI